MRFTDAALSALLIACAAAPAAADVQLSIENGQVSLRATNATAREILAEWTRVGRTQIVNGERVPGGPMTIQLTGVPEDQALKIILRSAAGYVTAPRRAAIQEGSRYDRILVMPTTTPARGAVPPPAPYAQPQFQQPPFPQAPGQFQQPPFPQAPGQIRQPLPINDDVGPEDPDPAGPNPRGPIFNTFPFPQPQTVPGSARPPVPVGTPMPVGAPAPGMIVPAPAQPGQPGQPVPVQREP